MNAAAWALNALNVSILNITIVLVVVFVKMDLLCILNSSPLRPRTPLPPPLPRPPICREKAPDLTRDQRRDIRLLREIGWKYRDIHAFTRATTNQIRTAVGKATPRKKTGRPPLLSQAQIDELVDFDCASAKNRRMTYTQLTEALDFRVKRDAIRTALTRKGFHRRLAIRKPPISPTNQKLRYE